MRALTVLCAVGVLAAGCGKVSISEMRPGMEGSSLLCWLTLTFKAPPKEGDARDVRVIFTSIALEEPVQFDWDYLTANDYLVKTEKTWLGDQDRFVIDNSTTSALEPGNQKLKVKFLMDSKKTVSSAGYTDMTLKADVYWAGKRQDSSTRGLFLAYQKQ